MVEQVPRRARSPSAARADGEAGKRVARAGRPGVASGVAGVAGVGRAAGGGWRRWRRTPLGPGPTRYPRRRSQRRPTISTMTQATSTTAMNCSAVIPLPPRPQIPDRRTDDAGGQGLRSAVGGRSGEAVHGENTWARASSRGRGDG
jgi:hypothetical protein